MTGSQLSGRQRKANRSTGQPQTHRLPTFDQARRDPPVLYDDSESAPVRRGIIRGGITGGDPGERPAKRVRMVSPEPSSMISADQPQIPASVLKTAVQDLLAQLESLPNLPGVAKHFLKGITAVVTLHEQHAELEARTTDGGHRFNVLDVLNEENEELLKVNKKLKSDLNDLAALSEVAVAQQIETDRYNEEYANNNIKLMNDFNPMARKFAKAVKELERRDDVVDALEEEVETFRLEEARLQAVIEGLTAEKAALEVQNLELHQQMENVQAPRKTRAADSLKKLTAENLDLGKRNKRQAAKIRELQQEVRSLNVELAKGKKGAPAEAVKSSNQKKDAAAGTAKSSDQKEDMAAGTVKHHVA